LNCLEGAIGSVSINPSDTADVLDIVTRDPGPIYHAIRSLKTHVTRGTTLPSVIFPIYLWFSPEWRRDQSLIRSFLMDKISAARKHEDNLEKSDELITDADCVLNMLIQQELREGSQALSTEELLDELMGFFL
jgi:cytochrome P450